MNAAHKASLRANALEIVRRLQRARFIAYWAGGGVRDMLRGEEPNDYDIATNATPSELARLFPECVEVGKAFAVTRVPLGGHTYEVATFRQDHGYRDGRHPEAVTFSDPVSDAQRRDFTINALFYDPVSEQIHDHVEGRKDLEARVVRTVGDPDVRFKEDHLRLLRAVRFASTLGFSIEPRTADAIVRNAALLGKVSADRIREELTRILLEAPQAGSALLMLNDLALLPVILPEVAAMKDQRQPEAFHPEGDVLTHTVLMLNMMKTDDRRLAYSVLLHDVGKPPTAQMDADRIRFDRHAPEGAELARRILERLRFSNEDIEAVTFCVGNHMRFMDVQKMRASTLRRLVGAPTFPIELELHRLDCLASHKDLDNYRFVVEFQEKLKNTPVLPKPWVTGEDIMSMGVPEGCEVGRWRKIVYDAQLEGKFADRSALLDWLREQVDAAKRGQTLPRGEP